MDLFSTDALRLLSAPFEDLSDSELALAISVAQNAGKEAAMAGSRVMPDFASRYPATETEYFVTVLRAARRAGILDDVGHAQWATDCESGSALDDPRVQAFCAAWTQVTALFRTPGLFARRRALGRFLEIPIDRIEIRGVGIHGQPLLRAGSTLYMVLNRDEATRTVPTLGAGNPSPRKIDASDEQGIEPLLATLYNGVSDTTSVHVVDGLDCKAAACPFGDHVILEFKT